MQKNKWPVDGIKHSQGPKKNKSRHKNVKKTRSQKKSRVFPSSPGKQKKNSQSKTLSIIPLGGNEEVGRNMNIFEYGQDIIIIDMGLQFPEEDMPGIDYIVPNISYLKGKEKRIRGVIFTHGHMDHIGAAPILLKKLGYPPIVGRDLTLALIKRKLEDHEKNSSSKLKTIRIKDTKEKVRLGKFNVGFFDVEHSIMDSMGIILETPEGTIIHPGDWTMDKNPADRKPITYDGLSKLPSPKILMLESLGATDTRKKEQVSEKEMYKNLEKIISESPGRVIMGTFSSQIRRIGHVIEFAEKIGKKVALDGYSLKMNIEIAKELGYIKTHKKTLIPISGIHEYADNKIVIICTGAQGEGNAVLSRIVTENHRYVKIQKRDTIIFSSSVVPGNERTIQRLKDDLYRKSDNVIHSGIMDVHASGHCNAYDIQEILKQIQPDLFLPVYANHYFLKEAAKLAREIDFPQKNIHVLDNGNVLEFKNKKAKVLKKKVDTSYVMVDGLGIGDVGQVVLRDRQLLSADGMFVVTVLLNGKTKEVVGNIQVTSRGFIYVKENFDLVNETKRRVQQALKETTSKNSKLEKKFIEDHVRNVVGKFLFQKTERRPMVLPVIIEV